MSCRTCSRRPGGRPGGTTRSRAPVVGWLLVITRARALDRLRARRARALRRRRSTSSTPDPVDPGPGQELQAIGNEEAARLRQRARGAAGRTTRSDRARVLQGLSQSDIAEKLEQPLGTVKTRMRTGLLKLRERCVDE